MTTEKNNSDKKTSGHGATPFAQTYFHGTRSDLKVGEFIEVYPVGQPHIFGAV